MSYLTQTCEEGLGRLLLRQMTVNWLPSDCCQKRSVCHPVLSVCVFQPAMGARCRNEGTWLIKWSKGCWKGLDTASTRGLDTHVFVFWDRERAGASVTEAGGPHLQHPARLAGLSHGAKARVEEEEVLTEESGVDINCISRPSTAVVLFSFLHFSNSKPQHPILLLHTQVYTHIPSERDGSVTIGKQRLLVTENALRREPPPAKRRKWWDYWRACTRRERGYFLPLSVVNCPDLQGLQGYRNPILVPSTLDSSWFKNNPKSVCDSCRWSIRGPEKKRNKIA